jgi:hypothetical protein
MLDKVISAARGFDLIEIEGDAAFLSRDAERLGSTETLNAVTNAAVAMHGAFHKERQLVQLNMCPCGSLQADQRPEAQVRRARRGGRHPDDQASQEAGRLGRHPRPSHAQEPG